MRFKNLLANLKKKKYVALNVLVDMKINSRVLYPLMKNRILKKKSVSISARADT